MKKESKKNGSPEEHSAPGTYGQSIEQVIAEKAYALYEKRGRRDGYDQENWLEAEQSVLSDWKPSEPIQKPLSRIPRSKAAR